MAGLRQSKPRLFAHCVPAGKWRRRQPRWRRSSGRPQKRSPGCRTGLRKLRPWPPRPLQGSAQRLHAAQPLRAQWDRYPDVDAAGLPQGHPSIVRPKASMLRAHRTRHTVAAASAPHAASCGVQVGLVLRLLLDDSMTATSPSYEAFFVCMQARAEAAAAARQAADARLGLEAERRRCVFAAG
jgi:hypothetical protein